MTTTRIELIDRPYWVATVKRMLRDYKFPNDYADATYENAWYDRWLKVKDVPWKLIVFGPATPFPPYHYVDIHANPTYPAITGWLWIDKAEELLMALLSTKTGTIMVDVELYGVIAKYGAAPTTWAEHSKLYTGTGD